jgi:dethiobiotin synthetase
MSAFFVTATGTDAGKTFITCGLIAALRRRRCVVDALKPVASGFDSAQPNTSDAGALLKALGKGIGESNLARISPWRFAAPLSPDMAAAREGRAIDFAALTAFTRDAVAKHKGTLLIEGVGGVMVPLTAHHTTLDWMAEAKLPLILVAGSYLGAISHALTAVACVRQQKLEIAALVVNESAGSAVDLQETAGVIARHTQLTPIVLPRLSGTSHAAFEKLADIVG